MDLPASMSGGGAQIVPSATTVTGPIRQGYFQLDGRFGAPLLYSAGCYFGISGLISLETEVSDQVLVLVSVSRIRRVFR